MDNQQLLEGLRLADRATIRYIYDNYRAAIVQFVEMNHGSTEDAEDILQEAITVVFEQSRNPEFTIKYQFLTYFRTIARNLWYSRLRKKGKREVTYEGEMILMVADESEKPLEHREEYFLYRKMFLRLPNDCQQVLSLYLAKVSMEKIAEKMGFSSVSYAKKRKFKCKEALIKLIKADPTYRELHHP